MKISINRLKEYIYLNESPEEIAALLTQWFGIGKSSFGWIVSMPSWTNVLQAALLPLLARGMTPKGLVLGMGWFNVALWAVMAALIGLLPRNDSPITIGFFLINRIR